MKAWRTIRAKGFGSIYRRLYYQYRSHREDKIYQQWIRQYDTLSEKDCLEIQREIRQFHLKPLISVLMPVYNVEEKWLRQAIESVLNQLYSNWEFCIADDASTQPHIRKVLEEYAAQDSRLKIVFRPVNGHISAASNSALELVTGEFVALLDHDDVLSKDALYQVAKEVNAHPDAKLIYSDEDMIDVDGKRYLPKFKPDWSPDFFYSMNLVMHLSVYRTSILQKIGGFRLGVEGSQDYDLALRVAKEISPSEIRHLPHILYHWRAVQDSVSSDLSEENPAHARAREALESHFKRRGIAAESVRGASQLHRTVYALPNKLPLISIIVVAKEESIAALENILSKTNYKAYELIVVADSSVKNIPGDPRVRKIDRCGNSFYSSLNEAVKESAGRIICFLNPSTTGVSPDWLDEIAGQVSQPEIGAVGVKILYPDNTIKHAGLILGIKNGVGRAHYKFSARDYGNNMRLSITQNFSALSIDCLAIRKEIFEVIGGFDVQYFPDNYGDVDLCLRLLEKDYRHVWTPWAELVQSGKLVFSDNKELEILKTRWPSFFEKDPYYNPNLTNAGEDFSPAFPPRVKRAD